MRQRAIVPDAARGVSNQLKLSPAIGSGNHVFLTGMTGSDADGRMPADPATQFRNAFDKIADILTEAGLGLDAMVEMTSFHVGLRDHFDLFAEIRGEYVRLPYPAWTAVEVAGLRREGAIVEIRVIATTDSGHARQEPDGVRENGR